MEEKGVIFVLVKDGKILMQLRDENCKKFPLMWCIPGGSCEDNEEYEDTLLREVKEEYDIDLKIEQCKYLTHYINKENKVYVCYLENWQIPYLHEGLEMKWMNIEEIKKIKLGFHQDELIKIIEDYLHEI